MIYALQFSVFDNLLTLERITNIKAVCNRQIVIIMHFYVCYSKYAILLILFLFVCFWRDSHPPTQWARASSFARFLDHTQRRTTVGRTPLDELSARRRDLYLTTRNAHNIQSSIPAVGFEPTISAGERPQTYALDRAATGTGS